MTPSPPASNISDAVFDLFRQRNFTEEENEGIYTRSSLSKYTEEWFQRVGNKSFPSLCIYKMQLKFTTFLKKNISKKKKRMNTFTLLQGGKGTIELKKFWNEEQQLR